MEVFIPIICFVAGVAVGYLVPRNNPKLKAKLDERVDRIDAKR